MKTLRRFSLFIALLVGWLSARLEAQTATVIPDSEAAQHVGQQATVEGIVVKVFTSKNGNTFLEFGAAYPNQTFTGWIPKDFTARRLIRVSRPSKEKGCESPEQ